MLIGYARTSTLDQRAGLEAQRTELKAAGCEKLFEEQVSSVDVTAREKLAEALALRPEETEFLYRAGRVHSRLHDADAALDYLARAVEGGYSADEIANTAALDELREDPRFEKMIDGK